VGNEQYRAVSILPHVGVVKEGENENIEAKKLNRNCPYLNIA
jgi:hypothetical protein